MRRTPAELFRAATARRGLERDAAVAATKTITAVLVSYSIALWVIDSEVPVFAPFAAFFAVQSTIYRSMSHGVRYLGAVVIGVVATGLIGLSFGQTLWSLALLVVITVLLGQWRGFAGYGPQIAVVGLFAFAVGGADESDFLVDLLLTVLAGAMTGLAANLVFAPRLKFHDVGQAVADVSTAVHDLLLDMAERLGGDDPLDRADKWRTRSKDLAGLVDRVHSDLDFGEEAIRFNPRRLAVKPPPYADSRSTIIQISAVVDHAESIARALLYADRSDGDGLNDSFLTSFLSSYANLLEPIARAVAAYGHRVAGGGDGLEDQLEVAFQRHRELAQSLAEARPKDSRMLADCGTMLLEAERLLSELDVRNAR